VTTTDMLLATLATAFSLTGGIAGTAVIDPAFPVCAVTRPCVAPDPYDTIVFWRAGSRAARTTTTANGAFRVALAPGRYTVTLPRRTGAGVTVVPTQLRVARGKMLHIVIHVDVGIR
jgi:hypothetical protein